MQPHRKIPAPVIPDPNFSAVFENVVTFRQTVQALRTRDVTSLPVHAESSSHGIVTLGTLRPLDSVPATTLTRFRDIYFEDLRTRCEDAASLPYSSRLSSVFGSAGGLIVVQDRFTPARLGVLLHPASKLG